MINDTMCVFEAIPRLCSARQTLLPFSRSSPPPSQRPSSRPHSASNHVPPSSSRLSCRTSQDDKVWVELLSWEPRAFAYHNFLSKEVRASATLGLAPSP